VLALRLLLASAALLAAVAVAGCGGAEGSTSAEPKLVSPAEFEQAIAVPDRVSINVHIPDEGSIEGTDVTLPFDQIEARQDELPGTSTPLAVYCRSGNMSADAVQTLADLGYVDVIELEGGMVAWEASGRPLLPPGA
jgi:rhodanese-related sulfurtransferase